MFLNVVSLLVGFLCLFVVLLILFNQKPNRKINGYLIAILVIVGLQRFLYAIEVLGFTNQTYSPLKIKPILAFYIVPIYYLFFYRLINSKVSFKKESVHFVLPTLIVLMNLVYVDFKLNRMIYLVVSTIYFVSTLLMVKQFFLRKNLSLLNKITHQATKKWLLIIIAITFLLIVYANCFLFQDITTQVHLNSFYKYSSLVWLVIIIYMFKNPIIIFGEQTLLKNIQVQLGEQQDFEIWSRKPLFAIEEKDKALHQSMFKKIDVIILEIKKLQETTSLISNITLNAEILAKELKIPKRQIDFIFKYFCRYSVNDFSNLVKVNYAISLINNGYLEKFTVASLGEKCLFNSRFTFSKNFKKFVGVSVSDFVDHYKLLKA